MKAIIKTIRNIARDDSGASAMEYALLATMVSTAFIMGAISLGTSINDVNQNSANEIDQVVAAINGATSSASNDQASDTGGKGKRKGKRRGKGKKGD